MPYKPKPAYKSKKYEHLRTLLDNAEPQPEGDNQPNADWLYEEFSSRGEGQLAQHHLRQYRKGIQTEPDGTKWYLQTRLHFPRRDKYTILYFRKVQYEPDFAPVKPFIEHEDDYEETEIE